MTDIILTKGLLLPELLKELPGLAGFVEIESWIRRGVLTPHKVCKIVYAPETGERLIRCQKMFEPTEFNLGRDLFNMACFRPPIEPAHFSAWAITREDLEDLIKLRPALKWPTKSGQVAGQVVSQVESQKLRAEYAEEHDLRLALERELAEIRESDELTIHCEGNRDQWGCSLFTVVNAAFKISEEDRKGLTKAAFEEELRAESQDPLLKEAYEIFWRLIPRKHKSGAGNPKYKS